jgi:hypothetical protein
LAPTSVLIDVIEAIDVIGAVPPVCAVLPNAKINKGINLGKQFLNSSFKALDKCSTKFKICSVLVYQYF